MTELIISPIVKVQIQLIARDDAFKNINNAPNRLSSNPFQKLKSTDYKNVKKKAKNVLKNKIDLEYFMSNLYNRGDTNISGLTLINTPIFSEKSKGVFLYDLTVCYSLKSAITFKELKKEVDEIFLHSRISGDVAYKLKVFKLEKTPQYVSFEVEKKKGRFLNFL